MNTELKPCPFCGETAKFQETRSPRKDSPPRYVVICKTVGCLAAMGVEPGFWNKSDVAKLWNARASETEMQALRTEIDALKHELSLFNTEPVYEEGDQND